MTLVLDELVEAGLITNSNDPHLSNKGREWLHTLEDVDSNGVDREEAAADLVLSTNGLFR